jgi:hypothetical protein
MIKVDSSVEILTRSCAFAAPLNIIMETTAITNYLLVNPTWVYFINHATALSRLTDDVGKTPMEIKRHYFEW